MFSALLFLANQAEPPAPKTPKPAVREISINGPLAVRNSIRIKKGTYVVADRSGAGVLRVEADNVEIDFQGATLSSTTGLSRSACPPSLERDQLAGIGVVINGHRNVKIRNANIHGYKWNIAIVNSKFCSVRDSDLSWSKAERIRRGGKAVGSFLNLRDPDAWKQYGAGLWLERSSSCKVNKIRCTGSQNGILLMKSDTLDIRECDVSFNSGWGIGLQGSSQCILAWNLADFVNRPWGEGWGGDSAGIVVVNGSDKNSVVGNSVTHGGDGFFLSDRFNGRLDPSKRQFEGSCNDNLVALNDGSYSPNNAFEATFSARNFFYRNTASQSNYGFWMGYSSETMLAWNQIGDNKSDGIAWEQGRGNWITGNTVARSGAIAIHCWSGTGELLKEFPSKDLAILHNTISGATLAFSMENSINLFFKDNIVDAAEIPEAIRSTAREEDLRRPVPASFPMLTKLSNAKPTGFRTYLEATGPRGLEHLKTDDYAPIDPRKK